MNVGTINATVQFVAALRTATLSAEVEVGSLGATAAPFDNEVMRYLIANTRYDPTTGCWHWLLGKSRQGYGTIGIRAIVEAFKRGAHRTSKMVFQGWEPVDRNEQIRHQCKARDCINPFHSLTGSAFENSEDRRLAGDALRKLSPQDVADILSQIVLGVPSKALAKRYGVDPSMISHIKGGRAFRSIPRP